MTLAVAPLAVFFPTLLVVGLAGVFCIRCVGPKGFMDVPGGRRQHARPIPRVGGLVLIASYLVLNAWLGIDLPLSPLQKGALLATALMGVLDDRFELRARWKALFGLGLALLLALDSLVGSGAGSGTLQLLWFELPGALPLRAVLLTLVFLVIPQAFNLIDGANGLALGYATMLAVVLTLLGAVPPALPILLAVLLLFNWPRAHLFLGDCGSLALGMLFALLAHNSFGSTNPNAILWLFAYPMVDVLQVVITRTLQGRSIFRADRNHLHHHLQTYLGRRAGLRTPILWLLATGCASGALADGALWVVPWVSFAVLALLALTCVLTVVMRNSLERAIWPSSLAIDADGEEG